MTMYVFAPNQTVEIFPYSIGALRRDNPGTSFPSVPSNETLAEWNVFPVADAPAPAHNAATQNCNQISPTLEDGEWTMAWEVTDASLEQVNERVRSNADYIAFWNALTTGTIYAAIREQSFTSLPVNTLATELIALLGDAKAGRPNEVAIQNNLNAILDAGPFTSIQLDELQAALVIGNLDNIYTIK
jgi:hypothetical protein